MIQTGNLTVTIVGGGFTGLAAALELAKAGARVTLLEKDSALGGLAGTFEIAPGCPLEKFYHHWFVSDRDALDLVNDLGISPELEARETNTGLYFSNSIFRLASPWDLLRFTPISLLSRIRTGLMVLKARRIGDYRELEGISAEEWIIASCGREAYEVIWRPLLEGKFGAEAKNISAVWFWNKLKLRGSSRGDSGEERLYHLRGGFQRLIAALEQRLAELNVSVRLNTPVRQVASLPSGKFSVAIATGTLTSDAVLVTTPIPNFLEIVPQLPADYRRQLSSIRYLGNVCLILGLKRSLSSTYWLNIADPSFPFVGVIEHTNFDPPENYGGMHVVYLSKYLPVSDPLYSLDAEGLFQYALPFLRRMFPELSEEWVVAKHLWREPYSQPIITKHYSNVIPEVTTPEKGLFLSTMAQVYPEDRGTSYAIRGGREAARTILARL